MLFTILAVVLSQARTTPSQVISPVTVIDVALGRAVPGQVVIITGNRISFVGPAAGVRPPPDAVVRDGRGAYLIPGLWDLHVHLGMAGRPALQQLVASGVIGVRDMGGEFEQVRAWRDSIRAGRLVGPGILMSGPIVENLGWRNAVAEMLRRQGDTAQAAAIAARLGVATPDDARAALDRITGLGADFVKVRNDPPPPAYFALLREARARGIPVTGHAPARVSLAAASDSGQASFEHALLSFSNEGIRSALDAMSAGERSALIARLAQNRTALVPTLIAGVGFRRMPDSVVLAIIDDTSGTRDPRRPLVSPSLARIWRGQMEMKRGETGPQPDWNALHRQTASHLAALDSAGVMVLAGTDLGTPLVYPGSGLHDELLMQVQDGGRTPARVLWGATLGAARFLGLDREFGTVAAGTFADLVLLDGNPLADIANIRRIRAVIRNGRWLDRAALDSLLLPVSRIH
jgi:imidazolonepropionase-like amidohydrolase